MPRIVAIQNEEHAADVVREIVTLLKSGQAVGLPGETTYSAAALATSSEIDVVVAASAPGRCWLNLNNADHFLDFAPSCNQRILRLVRRCWPGPLIVRVPDDGGSNSLSDEVSHAIGDQDGVAVTASAHPLVQRIQNQLPVPLVLSGDGRDAHRRATASELATAAPVISTIVDGGGARYHTAASEITVNKSSFHTAFLGIFSEQSMRVSACRIYLFVCTGNTCRSPLAEGLFRNLLAKRLDCSPDELAEHGYIVESAGLAAGSGSPASPETAELLSQRAIDLSDHESQPLTEQLLSAADHVFTMTNSHRETILRFRPDLADRVEVLRRDGGDVVDPIGGGMPEYQRCEQEIEAGLQSILDSHFREGPDKS